MTHSTSFLLDRIEKLLADNEIEFEDYVIYRKFILAQAEKNKNQENNS